MAALNWLVKGIGKHHYIDIACDVEGIRRDFFPDESELLLFRIFQEALTNIAKHARARQVSITAKRENGGIAITIVDSGVGFDVQAVTAPRAPSAAWGWRRWMSGCGCWGAN